MTLATLTDGGTPTTRVPRVVALDLSLTCTGVADANGCRTFKPKATGMERLADVRDALLRASHVTDLGSGPRCAVSGCDPSLYGYHPDIVVIEGYSFGTSRQQSHAHALGELGGVVRLALWEVGIPFVDVPPATLKKYATGKGNASKEAVLTAAVRRLGYDGHDNNEADALWLYTMAMDALGHPTATVPAEHRKALAAVKWPTLAVTTNG